MQHTNTVFTFSCTFPGCGEVFTHAVAGAPWQPKLPHQVYEVAEVIAALYTEHFAVYHFALLTQIHHEHNRIDFNDKAPRVSYTVN